MRELRFEISIVSPVRIRVVVGSRVLGRGKGEKKKEEGGGKER